jgi:glyceraldehyde-3-phosphate dehydrogenase (NADP+)
MKKAVELLKIQADSLANLLSQEIGKTLEDARSEIDRSIEYMEMTMEGVRFLNGAIYYGDLSPKYPRGEKTGYYNRVPLGVILAISPFNYPINLSITKIAPALIMGNCVILKPATQGSLTSYQYYKTFIDAGFPAGVFNLISGSSAEIGDILLTSEAINLIAFTGSTFIGRHIREVSLGVPLLLELGGKDAAIVSDQADLDLAARQITSGAFSYAGQRCTAQKIVFVFESVADALKERLVNFSAPLQLVPMIDSKSADYVLELVSDAESKGAEVVLRGHKTNNVLSATILFKVTDAMRIFHEEQFGPALPIVLVKDEADALAQASKSNFGLQASIYTQDLEQAFRIADKLDVGTVQINSRPDRGTDNFPFGGTKDSGQSMQAVVESLELMSRGKMTVLNLHKFSK